MIDLLLSLLLIVVVGFLVLCGGFVLFLRHWAAQEDRTRQQRDAAERIRLNRVMSASRPSWRATEAAQWNRKDGL